MEKERGIAGPVCMFPAEFLPCRNTLIPVSVHRFRHSSVASLLSVILLSTGAIAAAFPHSEAIVSGEGSVLAAQRNVPSDAVEVYRHVMRSGKAPSGYVGGRIWHNREHSLPPGGKYREFDVHPRVRGRNRGAERVIIDVAARRGWYTPDHYRTFLPIDPP
jgi:guanyl-specific ribonuclease Sa